MSHLAPLIADLALILICAGIMTLLFKKLKQPLVLGYVVAGFLASPHMAYTPSVMDTANIQTWADIGVIFLLFALGLEFSFKKIVKVGGAAIIAACTIIFCMILLGVTVGTGFGWKRMDCIFLGGMIAMSSTTIIYKAFDDLGMRKKQFTGLVLSVLILEDILAIVLMVMLSTMAVSHNFEGTEMLGSIAKLLFFLILWFVVGIYLIPGLLKRCRKLMSEETLLIVSLGLCFGMVVMAAHTGFSAAFGAFIMGSILAETVEAESIERLVKPVKDLFGAIFFVSVGMMVDPAMIVEYAGPIVVITLAVILGQSLFGTLGVLLAGQPLKTAMQCGFSLTQIGEFAFIIASLGVSLHVTSHFLYPIVVAVLLVTLMILSRQLKKQSIMIERTFFQNLRYRDMRAEYMGEKKPEYAGRLLSRDLHLTDFEIPGESAWVGRTLAELNFGKKYGIHVVSILRGKKRINIPGASVRLFPQDKIQVIATDEELNIFGKEMDKVSAMNTDVIEKSEMILRQFCVDGQSPFLNKTLKEAGIREKYHCLIAGVERGGETLHAPDPHEPFVEGDVVWVVGESADVYELVSQKGEGFDMEV